MKIKLSILILSVMFIGFGEIPTPQATTPPQISGAFGILLGEEYTGELKENSTDNFYYIESKNIKQPFRNFKTYSIIITPKSKKVSAIRAEYQATSIKDAILEVQIIEKIIEEKYKTTLKKHNTKTPGIYYSKIEGENRHISISRNKNIVRLIYIDAITGKTGNIERQEIIQEEVKKSNSNAI